MDKFITQKPMHNTNKINNIYNFSKIWQKIKNIFSFFHDEVPNDFIPFELLKH
jgi:hypothetical protein